MKSNSLPWVSAPMRSASSVSRNVRVWLLGPYASTLILPFYLAVLRDETRTSAESARTTSQPADLVEFAVTRRKRLLVSAAIGPSRPAEYSVDG